jgi:hypothetical protein
VLLRAISELDRVDYLKTALLARSAILNTSDQQSIDAYNKILKQYDLAHHRFNPKPGKSQGKAEKPLDIEKFKSIFKDGKAVKMAIGKPISPDQDIPMTDIKDLINIGRTRS